MWSRNSYSSASSSSFSFFSWSLSRCCLKQSLSPDRRLPQTRRRGLRWAASCLSSPGSLWSWCSWARLAFVVPRHFPEVWVLILWGSCNPEQPERCRCLHLSPAPQQRRCMPGKGSFYLVFTILKITRRVTQCKELPVVIYVFRIVKAGCIQE